MNGTMGNFVGALLGAALLSTGSAFASVYVVDPVPTNGVSAYTNNANLTGQAPTNAAIVGEGTNFWGQGLTATSALFSDGTGLVYGASMAYPASGGAFACRYSGANTDGRLLSRPIRGLPTGGTIYLSMLTKVEYKALTFLNNGMSLGMGLATNAPATSTPTAAIIPSNGIYFGYCTNAINGQALVINVAGTNCTLVANPATNTTYLCVARIDIGAGPGGKDIIYAVANPATMPATQADYAVVVTNTVLNGSAFSQLSIGGGYRTGGYRIWFDEIRVGSLLQDVFAFDNLPCFAGAPAITGNTDGTFAFSATLTNVTSDTVLLACYGATTGFGSASTWALSMPIAAPPTANVAATGALSAFATNTCYVSAALATNAGNVAIAYGPVFMTGEVWLTPNGDAFELGQVSGGVVVHRPVGATQLPLTINYTVAGTATPGVDYATNALTGSLTLAAGQDSATLSITPFINTATTSNTTVGITLAPGPYWIGAASTVAVTVSNCNYNIWQAPAASFASVAANWSLGRAPLATDDILLSTISTNDLFWDAPTNGLPAAVNSWTQLSNYTGTVMFPITYTNVSGATFTNFAVTGIADIEGGAWTHPSNTSAQVYHLQATVGGSFTLGSAAAVNLQYKGWGKGKWPAGGAQGVHGGARGDFTQVYGNVYAPSALGAGGGSVAGGGALWLEVGGAAIVNGTINADSYRSSDTWNTTIGGAGGSIYVKAASVAGTGSISANGTLANGLASSGGRIAVILTQTNTLGLSLDAIYARGDSGSTAAGGGTVFIKTLGQTNGTLVVDSSSTSHGAYPQFYPTPRGTTCVVPGETWTFDAIITRRYGVLSIPPGATLVLPNGFASVSSTDATVNDGILYLGGNLVLGTNTPYLFQSNWVFHAYAPYTITGDVSVVNGGALGCVPLRNTLADYATMALSVVGNLTVDGTSRITALNTGVDWDTTTSRANAHGGQPGGTTSNVTYDSILRPVRPGMFGGANTVEKQDTRTAGGGVLQLAVTGTLNVDGFITASAKDAAYDNECGGAGSINISAGMLTGTGRVEASGYRTIGNAGKYFGGGGRIAIRLTGSSGTFADFGVTNIQARGGSNNTGSQTNMMSSAGTVYLETKADGTDAGTVYVYNDGGLSNTVSFTPFPSRVYEGTNDTFRSAALELGNAARVKLFESLAMRSATVKTNTVLNLNGYTLTLRGMTLNGVRVPAGTYSAAGFASGVTDSSVAQTGRIIIIGGGTAILFR